jgi:hypothetical protein
LKNWLGTNIRKSYGVAVSAQDEECGSNNELEHVEEWFVNVSALAKIGFFYGNSLSAPLTFQIAQVTGQRCILGFWFIPSFAMRKTFYANLLSLINLLFDFSSKMTNVTLAEVHFRKKKLIRFFKLIL